MDFNLSFYLIIFIDNIFIEMYNDAFNNSVSEFNYFEFNKL